MNEIYIKARAKINLTLNILNKRLDGYHNLESVFQKINLYDEIYIEKTNSDQLYLACNSIEFENQNNIIHKVYDSLKEKYPNISGIKVTLIKHIPSGAGLGGGSTDAASFLTAMNKLFNLNCSESSLIEIGKTLGADVPPCLHTGSLFAQGIGEIITNIDQNLEYYIVLVKPDISFSTKLMFLEIDNKADINQKYNSKNMIKALETGDINLLSYNLYNVFEELFDENSEIKYIKKLLTQNGAINSLMTGSGSCVFGIFNDKESSKIAYHKIKNQYETYWCIPYNRG